MGYWIAAGAGLCFMFGAWAIIHGANVRHRAADADDAAHTWRTYVINPDTDERRLIFEGAAHAARMAAINGALEYGKPCIARRERIDARTAKVD